MKRSEKLISKKYKKPNGELWGEDKLDDNNQTEYKLKIMFIIKLLRMFYILTFLVLLIAVLWKILVKQTYTGFIYSLFKDNNDIESDISYDKKLINSLVDEYMEVDLIWEYLPEEVTSSKNYYYSFGSHFKKNSSFQILTSCYFALTSLATVGFGDLRG